MRALRCLNSYALCFALLWAASPQIQAVPFSGFENMEAKKSYFLGTLESGDWCYRLVLLRRGMNREDDYRYMYIMRFWPDIGKPPYPSGKKSKLGTIVFFKRGDELNLCHIYIAQRKINGHLARPFIKAFCQFAHGMGHQITTTQLSRRQRHMWFISELQTIGFKKTNLYCSSTPLHLPTGNDFDENLKCIEGEFIMHPPVLGGN